MGIVLCVMDRKCHATCKKLKSATVCWRGEWGIGSSVASESVGIRLVFHNVT